MRRNFLNHCLVTIFMSLLIGCAPPVGSIINQAIRDDNTRAVQRDKVLLAEHLKLIETLRAAGDPMGDYLWAEANEHQLVPNFVTDPVALKQLYQTAAYKGSLDASNKVGLITFSEGAIGGNRYAQSTDAEKQQKEIIWRKGLAVLEESTARQCFYWGIILDGMANRRCLRPVVVARQIWPKFRDGFGYPKDSDLAQYWREKRDTCDVFLAQQSPDFFLFRAFPTCR